MPLARSGSFRAVDRGLGRHDEGLAASAALIPELDVRLVLIDAKEGTDQYHVLQGLEDASGCYAYQRWGRTGTDGECKIEGPMEREEVKKILGTCFLAKTGKEWGTVSPGDRALPGKYWLQREMRPDLKAKWEYYVGDGVDGKKPDWYPYTEQASEEMEEIYAQHVADEGGSRTATRVVASGYFSYRVNLSKMTQQNTRTRKERKIRRAFGSALPARAPPAPMKVLAMKKAMRVAKAMKAMKVMKAMKAMKTMKAMKVMKKAMKKAVKPVSKVARGKKAKKEVWSGKKVRTTGKLKKEDLMVNKRGKVVSKSRSVIGKQRYDKQLGKWMGAIKQAREELGLTGTKLPKKDSPLYVKAMELYPKATPLQRKKTSDALGSMAEPAPLVRRKSSKRLLDKGAAPSPAPLLRKKSSKL